MAYIYEYIRAQGYEPMHFEEHYARLDALSCIYFGNPINISQAELRNAIVAEFRKSRFSESLINLAFVKCLPEGQVEVKVSGIIYNEFSLRAIRPHAYICRIGGRMLTDNTSAKEGVMEFNQNTTDISNGGVALWVTEQEEVVAIDGASVIGVFDDEICFSQSGQGVEFDLAYTAAKGMKRNVTKRAIMLDELPKMKELLYIDYRGITAVQLYYPYPQLDKASIYMDITAERLAKQISKIEDCY